MNASNRFLALAALSVACLGSGCASAATQGASGGRRQLSQLTQSELAATNSDNLYDALVKLRPEWLSTRGPTSATDLALSSVDVYMGGTLLGKADYLREVRLLDVSEVRYWDAGQASARFGMGHPRGVIELTRR
jgi:hypothetical protein